MYNIQKFFITGPARDEAGASSSNENNEKVNPRDTQDQAPVKSEKNSIKDALQEWSNDNARDIEEDNSTPMRSNL